MYMDEVDKRCGIWIVFGQKIPLGSRLDDRPLKKHKYDFLLIV